MQKQVLISLSIDELKAVIQEAVKEELQFLKEQPSKSPDDFIDANAVCKILHISIPTTRKYRREGHLKSYRIGSTIRFKKSEVEKALKDIHYIKHSRKTL
jgi:excisionase family DNA binding protein